MREPLSNASAAERMSLEACRQSRRIWSMHIDGPLPALTVLPDCVVAEPGGRPIAPSDDAIAIGPEGGWSNAELAAARGNVSLGPNILRVETAAVAALTVPRVVQLLTVVKHVLCGNLTHGGNGRQSRPREE